MPSLAALDSRIARLGQSNDGGAPFELADVEDVLRETKRAYALALQAIWERQLRAYLLGCACELTPSEFSVANFEKADWSKLQTYFARLRGIELKAFPSFGELDTLQHLGNACRHGDGKSGQELTRRCPDLWTSETRAIVGGTWTVTAMNIPVERLRDFGDAVIAFWKDAEFIYCESLKSKSPTLEARLAKERHTRRWLP